MLDRKLKVTRRVSVGRDGEQADGLSGYPSISADGRFVAFVSNAENLVPGDTNGDADIFVRDRKLKVTRRVSVSSDGDEGNDDSQDPAISADGRFVAFTSQATDLVGSDTNGEADIFVRDRKLKVTRRVSVGKDGAQGDGVSYEPAISADGRWVAFHSEATTLVANDGNGKGDVFVHDRRLKVTRRVSMGHDGEADSDSYEPALSADGRFVAFSSFATNLVPGDDNGKIDIFIRDRKRKLTRRLSVGYEGEADGPSYVPSISADGRFVAFESYAGNLVRHDDNTVSDIFIRDRLRRVTRRISVGHEGEATGASSGAAISADGRYAAFASWAANLVANDTNATEDVFARGPLR